MGEPLPETYTVTYEKVQDLRYGENPHQKAAFYSKPLAASGNVTTAEQLHGKELSYNNISDANAALAILKEFDEPAVVAVKHMNPCGVGIGATIHEAYQKAYAADPTSIFGGIVAANRTIGVETAELLGGIFLEIIIAPDFTPEALEVLTKKKNIRLMKLGELSAAGERKPEWLVTSVDGGMLVQESDVHSVTEADSAICYRPQADSGRVKAASIRLESSKACEIQRDSACKGRYDNWCRRRPNEPRRSGPHCDRASRRSCKRLGTGVRCILPNGRYSGACG